LHFFVCGAHILSIHYIFPCINIFCYSIMTACNLKVGISSPALFILTKAIFKGSCFIIGADWPWILLKAIFSAPKFHILHPN
jgi:hypothetical protein